MKASLIGRALGVALAGSVMVGGIAGCESMGMGEKDKKDAKSAAAGEVTAKGSVGDGFAAAKAVFKDMGIETITAANTGSYAVVAGQKPGGSGVQAYVYPEGSGVKLKVTSSAPANPAMEAKVLAALKTKLGG